MVSTNNFTEQLHKGLLVWDAHRDVAYEAPLQERFMQRWTIGTDMHLSLVRSGGVKVQVYAIAVAPTLDLPPTAQALKELDSILNITNQHSSEVEITTNISQVHQAILDGKLAAILSFEGGEPIVNSLGLLRMFYRLGIRSIALTWNFRNAIADGSYEDPGGGGLTQFGRTVVREMNELGMLIDIAHMTNKGTLELIELSDAPVILSHGGIAAINPVHHRAYKDIILEKVASKGGVFCLTTIPEVLSKEPNNASLSTFVDHIDYAIKLIGEDYVGLGGDFDVFQSHLGLPGSHWLKDLEEVDKWPNVTAELFNRGYSLPVIRKIMGENLHRLYSSVIG